jgi:plastocyanin/tartrate dehydratase beta subunit/fumarate hydratase class I family protein
MTMKLRITLAAVLCAAGLSMLACGGDEGGADTATTDTAKTETTGDTTTGDAATGDTATTDTATTDTATADTTATDTGTTDTTATDTATTDTAAGAPTCADYCKVIMANCTGDNLQYKDEGTCVAGCTAAKLTAGTDKDTDKNTLGCRIYHAGAAKTDAKLHCPHAGATGGDVCGKYCDNFCASIEKVCTADLAQYKDAAECKAACAKAPTTGKATDTSGDSLQCLTYHIGVASVSPELAKIHCAHGKYPNKPGDPCAAAAPAPTCADYCKVISANCTGDNAQYGDEAKCVKFCTDSKLAAGTAADKAGNTIGCRTYHAGAAKDDANLHCPHAGPTGGDVCGKHCDNFCELMGKACTGANAQYKDDAECKAACAKAPTTGKSTDTGGDSLQCLTYHIGVASASADNAKVHCAHGKYPNKEGDPCAAKAMSKEHVVTTKGFAFDPPELTVAVGDTVKFTPGSTHNVVEVGEADWMGNKFVAKAGGFTTGATGVAGVYKAEKAGSMYYMCQPHAPDMKGKIIIK